MDNYDRIDLDFHGHTNLGGDGDSDDDLTCNIDEAISKKIESIEKELEYYNLFQKCLSEYTQFEITQARLLNENIIQVERDIEYGQEYLDGKPSGTHGKDCSTQLDSLNKQLDRLLNLWKDIPFDLKKLVKFNLYELP